MVFSNTGVIFSEISLFSMKLIISSGGDPLCECGCVCVCFVQSVGVCFVYVGVRVCV